ncbi:MAG TPA: Hsp70 family protein [Blastocatellia bacterium]|nr:Hsp70 family protein [Blastocatellia bacterium]
MADFELSLDVDRFYFGDGLQSATLTIRHTGTVGSIQIELPKASQPWVSIDTSEIADPTVYSGSSITVPVEIDSSVETDDYHEALIEVESKIGLRTVRLEVVPRPILSVSRGDYPILLDLINDEACTGHIELKRGVVTVNRLSTSVPWAEVKLVKAEYPYRLDARANRRLEFEFVIDESYLLNDIQIGGRVPPVDYAGNLVIDYAELTPAREEPFHVNCLLPPDLVIKEEEGDKVPRQVFIGQRSEVDMTLRNGEIEEKGRADLQITALEVDVDWLKPKTPLSFPLRVTSGSDHPITLAINTDGLAEEAHTAKITLLTNLAADGGHREVFFDITISRMEDFDGFLAIDFGTTNSCCAYWDNSVGDIKLIDIDLNSNKKTTAPSAILYNDLLDGDRKDYEIGLKAYELSTDPLTASYTVTQVKRRLGQPNPLSIAFYRDRAKRANLLPKEVTADIIKRIVERAEETLNKKVRQCVISHPSRFLLSQINDLKWALSQCGIDSNAIKTVHEPVGAAFDYLLGEENQHDILARYEKYHLMVFDFGGGTTDITLLRIANEFNPVEEFFTVRPKILGATGNSYLGGEDVTDIVMEIVLEKCYEILRSKNPDAKDFLIPLKEDFRDPQRRAFARENTILLRSLSERTKLALSEGGGDRVEDFHGTFFHVTVIIDGAPMRNYQFQYQDIAPSAGELDERLRPKLEQVIELMRRLARNNKVDAPEIILLSGKSSALPLVKKMIKEEFPGSVTAMPTELKECVVRGACVLFLSEEEFSKVQIRPDHNGGMSATTSRLGIRVFESGKLKFKQIVDAGVPIDPPSLVTQVKGIGSLTRNKRISIMENTGLDDDWSVGGKDNRNIKELETFSFGHSLSLWEQKHNLRVTDDELERASVYFEVTPDLKVKLLARIPGHEHEPIEFETEIKWSY